MNLFFWMLLNLGVPIVGPVFTLALVAPAHGWTVAKELIADSIKDGQLFWCAIGLCAAGVYELVTALEQGSAAAPIMESGIVAFCLLAFACSIVVMTCLLSTRYARPAAASNSDTARPAARTFSRTAIGCSIASTCAAALLLAILHICIMSFMG
ncbi:hypothetical protein SCB29_19110 [Paraburkholderia sp. SIMBA_055]|uniref:hypothetical protein n=1 Tax=Paraburkholderia TaxID=1822464 RepID=UPI000D304540|nr:MULTISPECIES: hypothetical protein [unclassified Paraburkholderia]PTR00422.1 hypothetical protein C8K19_105190 [Paraburkholderia sp. GV072]PUB05270.1 hypothetical protein C8K18_105190 [Paraburkholderia sp. GV068]